MRNFRLIIISIYITIGSAVFSPLLAKPNLVRVTTPAELQSALDRALPNDLIQMEPGKYALTQAITIKRSGLRTQPITVIPAVKSRTIITGPFGFECIDAEHVSLEGLVWFKISEHPVIRLRGECSVKIIQNEFHKCGLLIDQFAMPDKPRYPPVYMNQCYARLCQTELLLRLTNPMNRILVNAFDRCSGTIQMEGDNQLFRSNYFLQQAEDEELGPHIVGHGKSIKILNNHFQYCTSPPPLIALYHPLSAVIAQNTFYHCANPIVTLTEAEDPDEAMRCIIENNLIANAPTRLEPAIAVEGDGSELTWGNNLVFPIGPQTNVVTGTTTELKRWIVADPELILSDSVWHITPESPAVDAGSNRSGATLTDIEGRIRGLRADIGAHEISNETPAHPLPTSVLGNN